jgi:hypothetical protein
MKPIVINSDNTGAMDMAKDPKFHARMKHIDIQYHFIGEVVADEKVQLEYIPEDENIANILTKLLTPKKFAYMAEQLGLHCIDY